MNTPFGYLNQNKCTVTTMSGEEEREQGEGSPDPEMSKVQLELRLLSQPCKVLELEPEVATAKGNAGTHAGESSDTPPNQDAHAELRHFSKLLAGALPKFPRGRSAGLV